MAAFDFDAALRWFRFDPAKRLVRRPDEELPFLHGEQGVLPSLLLDSCVYIDRLRGRLTSSMTHVLDRARINHSTVCIQELMFGIGTLNPNDHRTAHAISTLRALVTAMRPHRTFAPDPDLLGRAAMLAGLLCRLQNYSGDSRKRALMDATLFLQAQKLGLTTLTRNIGDFDLLLQLVPTGRAIFYREVV